MKRETTNRIRWVLEDLLPPALRDSGLFRRVAKLAWGEHIDDLAGFRARAPFLSDEEYEALYLKHPRVQSETDNSQACVERIAADIVGHSVADIGCGTGALLERIRQRRPGLQRLVGVDFAIDDAQAVPGLEYVAAKIEQLPFADGEFDTVVCTHVIEHVLEPKRAIAELRRIAARRVIIVVPREREYRYTFNPHFNFYPYTHSFLREVHPVPEGFAIEDVGRDIYYREDILSERTIPVTIMAAAE